MQFPSHINATQIEIRDMLADASSRWESKRLWRDEKLGGVDPIIEMDFDVPSLIAKYHDYPSVDLSVQIDLNECL